MSIDTSVTDQVVVAQVFDNSSASRAGIREGDVILEMSGVKVGDFDALRTAISKIKIGQKASVVILRGKKKMTLEITMGSR